ANLLRYLILNRQGSRAVDGDFHGAISGWRSGCFEAGRDLLPWRISRMLSRNVYAFPSAMNRYINMRAPRSISLHAACLALTCIGASVLHPVLAQTASRTVEDGGTGPYKALMVSESTLPTHTVFRPEDLGAFGRENT